MEITNNYSDYGKGYTNTVSMTIPNTCKVSTAI